MHPEMLEAELKQHPFWGPEIRARCPVCKSAVVMPLMDRFDQETATRVALRVLMNVDCNPDLPLCLMETRPLLEFLGIAEIFEVT